LRSVRWTTDTRENRRAHDGRQIEVELYFRFVFIRRNDERRLFRSVTLHPCPRPTSSIPAGMREMPTSRVKFE
jgi:hypothetical protein